LGAWLYNFAVLADIGKHRSAAAAWSEEHQPLSLFASDGVKIKSLKRDGDNLLAVVNVGHLQPDSTAFALAVERVLSRLSAMSGVSRVQLFVQSADGEIRPLEQILPKSPVYSMAQTAQIDASSVLQWKGALSGKTIAISPGHGWYCVNGNWHTQRGDSFGLIEDFHTNEIAFTYLIPQLERAGALVHSVRERDANVHEVIVDNDVGAPAYVEQGIWKDGSYTGYKGSTYRATDADPTGIAKATYTPDIPADGDYSVWLWFRANATYYISDVPVTVQYGRSLVANVQINQQINDQRWVYIGTYFFYKGRHGSVTISNKSQHSGHIIADAVRFGGGRGDVPYGACSKASNKPRWQESAQVYSKFRGAPTEVWNVNDVIARPIFAEWQGAHAYLSIHTDAYTSPDVGTGTSTFIHDTKPTAGSKALQNSVHTELIRTIRSLWDNKWSDRGQKTANFGEVRELKTMPGVLVEIAFHDNSKKDNPLLHHPHFRRDTARAMYKGLVRYLSPNQAIAPLPPSHLSATNLGSGRVRIAWHAVSDPLDAKDAQPTHYRVYLSEDGRAFDRGRESSTESIDISGLNAGQLLFFRVAAQNAGGESLPTEILGLRIAEQPEVLLVQGYDRRDRYVKEHDNPYDTAISHANALADAHPGYGFDVASNEAIEDADIKLSSYKAVAWILGRESVDDETFSAKEQTAIANYLQNGGSLIASGSEIAFHLDFKGSNDDKAFLRKWFGVAYKADDAKDLKVLPANSGPFAGMTAISLNDGKSPGSASVSPDVLSPVDGGVSVLEYSAGAGTASISLQSNQHRTLILGFPIETVISAPDRAEIYRRALLFLLGRMPIIPEQPVPEPPPEPSAAEPPPEPSTAEPLPDAAPMPDYAEPFESTQPDLAQIDATESTTEQRPIDSGENDQLAPEQDAPHPESTTEGILVLDPNAILVPQGCGCQYQPLANISFLCIMVLLLAGFRKRVKIS
jgi:N-acetylmuramoyl-L-alanine amidase